MRSLLVLIAALTIVAPSAFAQKGGQNKKLAKVCREENPKASKAEIKKCVKEKARAAKAG